MIGRRGKWYSAVTTIHVENITIRFLQLSRYRKVYEVYVTINIYYRYIDAANLNYMIV